MATTTIKLENSHKARKKFQKLINVGPTFIPESRAPALEQLDKIIGIYKPTGKVRKMFFNLSLDISKI